MALQIYNGNSIGTGVRANLSTTDDIYVGKNGFLGSTDDVGIEGSGANHHVQILGTVVGHNSAVALGDGSAIDNNLSVYIAAGAQLYALIDYAAYVYGYSSTFENHGLIQSEQAGGVRLAGQSVNHSSSMVNTGVIDVHTTGVYRSGSEDFSLLNTGTIKGASSAFYGFSSTGDLMITNKGLMDGAVYLGYGNDEYTEQGSGYATGSVGGGVGDDVLKGGSGANAFYGGDDNDTLNGGGGNDKLHGNAGNDVLSGGDGHDMLEGGTGYDKLDGGSGNDTLSGGEHSDTVLGAGGRDNLAGGNGNDVLKGGGGNDKVNGDGGNDKAYGGGGKDIVDGGAGFDQLWGNKGADIFAFSSTGGTEGTTRVKDYRDGKDMLDFSAYGVSFNQIKKASKTKGDDLLIKMAKLGGDGKVFIEDMQKSDFDAGDVLI